MRKPTALLIFCTTFVFSQQSSINLKNGKTIYYERDFERDAVSYLNGEKERYSPEQRKMFFLKLESVDFVLGKAEITKESMLQLKNVAEIAKAYGLKKIHIIALASKMSDNNLSDLQLTTDRAESVKSALENLLPNIEITALGLGTSFAKIPHQSEVSELMFDRCVMINFE